MNIVRITNRIALATVVLLMYWVFIFICSNVFGFKVFRENMTQMFLLSILGIFSILAGAIILNIMFNLTAIADGHRREDATKPAKTARMPAVAFLGSLVVIFALLYVGDIATSKQKEGYLVASASTLLQEQQEIIDQLADYSFTRTYIRKSEQNIKVLGKIEEKFPMVTVIARDTLDGKPVLLRFTGYSGLNKDEDPDKADFILSTSSEERQYLHAVFDGKTAEHRFSANDGRYEIYFPVKTAQGQIVFHLSQFSRYGKMGS